MKKILLLLLIGSFTLTLLGCTSTKMTEEQITEVLCDDKNILNVRTETIEIPNIKGEYRFIYISDLHIIVQSDEIAESDITTIQNRYQSFSNAKSTNADAIFEHIVSNINQTDVDAVLMGGDMIDYLSEANWNFLKAGLDSLEKPYLFATADHDVCTWWTYYTPDEEKMLKDSMGLNLVNTLEYDDFIVLSVSENTSQLSPDALLEIEQIFSIGKPIILVTHVPFEPLNDSTLGEMSKVAWSDRKLIWGQDCYYSPDETTQKFMNMIYADNSPVVAVIAGHLHFEHIGMLNNTVKQYVFNPAYTGEIVLFTIKGE